MKKYIGSVLFLSFLMLSAAQAQEIIATVRVVTPQLQKTDRKVFDVLETSVKEFLNNTKWSDDVFEPQERIRCNFKERGIDIRWRFWIEGK